jgi:hypothetical protein
MSTAYDKGRIHTSLDGSAELELIAHSRTGSRTKYMYVFDVLIREFAVHSHTNGIEIACH